MKNKFFSILGLPIIFCAMAASHEKDHTEHNSVSNFLGAPDAIVDGCINTITGDFFIKKVDAVINGSQPLTLMRTYSSSDGRKGNLCHGWSLNHYGKLRIGKSSTCCNCECENKAFLSGSCGTRLEYCYDNRLFNLSPEIIKEGLTNIGGHKKIGGRFDANNEHIVCSSTKKPAHARLINGAGDISYYKRLGDSNELFIQSLLKREGFSYDFLYNMQNKIEKISLKSPTNEDIASFKLHHLEDEKQGPKISIVSSNLHETDFQLSRSQPIECQGEKAFLLKSASGTSQPTTKYEYEIYTTSNGEKSAHIAKEVLPEGKYRSIKYYSHGENIVCGKKIKIKSSKDPRIGRVCSISAPVGKTEKPITTLQLTYHEIDAAGNMGTTTVYDAYRHQTNYTFRNRRLTTIERFTGNGIKTPYSRELFYWSNKGELINTVLSDSGGWNQACHYYKYDAKGNVLEERRYGNISGNNSYPLIILPDGTVADAGCEYSSTRFTYDDNNLVKEEIDSKSFLTYRYNDKDLLVAKFVYADNKIQKRYFYCYNDDALCVREVVDDGIKESDEDLTGVTQRQIEEKLYTAAAPFGTPSEVISKYWDHESGTEEMRTRTVNIYSPQGNLVRQEIYDNDNLFVYALSWEYDGCGNLVKEVDAYGNCVAKTYDSNHNLVWKEGPRENCANFYRYDFANRLVKEGWKLSDGTILTKGYSYTLKNAKEKETDFYGNETSFSYDHLNRLATILYPPIKNSNGASEQPSVVYDYDILGNRTLVKDCNNRTTKRTFTINNAPYQINHPSGECEQIVYNIDGTVKEHSCIDGTFKRYAYDWDKRPIQIEIFDKEGGIIDQQLYKYDAFNLLEEKSTLRGVTKYSYDCTGNLASKNVNGRPIYYEYNSRGLLARKIEECGNRDSIVSDFEYDLTGRVASQKIYDGYGNLQDHTDYSYDCDGNKTLTLHHTPEGSLAIKSTYDSLCRPIIDVKGKDAVTRYHYLYDFIDKDGEPAAATKEIDGAKNITLTIFDKMGRETEKIKQDSSGTPISSTVKWRDGNGNLTKQMEKILYAGELQGAVIKTWEYSTGHGPDRQIEESEQQKTTEYAYYSNGKIKNVVKPDGISIHFSYDQYGRLAELKSSNGVIHYLFDYHGVGSKPSDVLDKVTGKRTARQYDNQGNLIWEKLANSHSVGYRYDALNREINYTLTNEGVVDYQYQGQNLVSVGKKDRGGRDLYRHYYESYFLPEVPLKESLIGNAGSVTYRFDDTGKVIKTSHKSWEETFSRPNGSGYYTEKSILTSSGSQTIHYQFDALGRATLEEGASAASYSYDSLGSIRAVNGKERSFDQSGRLLTDEKGRNYSYDECGNLIEVTGESGTIYYAYDPLDRLVSVSYNEKEIRYLYDGFNRCITKETIIFDKEGNTLSKESISLLYHKNDHIALLNEKNQLLEHRIVDTMGRTVALEIGSKSYATIFDKQGNIAALIDSNSGQLYRYYLYNALGEWKAYKSHGQEAEEECPCWLFKDCSYDPAGMLYWKTASTYFWPEVTLTQPIESYRSMEKVTSSFFPDSRSMIK